MNAIAKDFDRIANAEQKRRWGHNNHYHSYLLGQINRRGKVLDVGCGAGDFCEELSSEASQVVGLDLSPNMIAKALEHADKYPNVSYQVGDYLQENYSFEEFDYIFSIATVHHFSLADFVQKAKKELTVGGKLVVLDLCNFDTTSDKLTELVAIPTNWTLDTWRNRGIKLSWAERLAWEEHQAKDQYLTLDKVKSTVSQYLPEAVVRRHLFWRYSLIWTKGTASG